MNETLNIGEQSCALVAKRPDGKFVFLGSGFFFVHAGRVLAATAAHCVPAVAATSLQLAGSAGTFEVLIASIDRSVDLCVLLPKSWPTRVSIVVEPEHEVRGNVPLYTYEYSTSELKGGSWHLNPATRIGNCVRVVQLTERFGAAGEDMLELSFPALRGASGAPVLDLTAPTPRARGVLVANAERHLLPAHIETVLTEDNALLEERKYFLPQAVAVHAKHLGRLVEAWHRENPQSALHGT